MRRNLHSGFLHELLEVTMYIIIIKIIIIIIICFGNNLSSINDLILCNFAEIKQPSHYRLFIHMSFTNCTHAPRPLPQVKIWFQNKRSKFKKLLKQGGNPHETDPIPGSMSLSPRSPTIPPIWDVSASSKGVNMPANSYMPGYSHWYSSPHQDSMQR